MKEGIRIKEGDILEADTEALVNTVNTVGVMGKGIALQFKRAYPGNYKAYKKACDEGRVEIGRMFTWSTDKVTNPRYIINFPTKKHWRGKSKLEYIEDGLEDLKTVLEAKQIQSIAIPPLGCGHGGLTWQQVCPLIERSLGDVTGLRVDLYRLSGSSARSELKTQKEPPRLTRVGALLVAAVELYLRPGYKLGRLEAQKLGYLLQVLRAPDYRFTFKQDRFGPYSEGLTHLLERLDGYYLQGFGDRSGSSAIEPLPKGLHEARNILGKDPDAQKALDALKLLIQGYETPYGLELLASVHWALHEPIRGARKELDIVERVQAWNKRKQALFSAAHIEKALLRLETRSGWEPGPPTTTRN